MDAKKSTCITNYSYHYGGLEITFTGNRVYRYDAPDYVYEQLCTASSKGGYYNTCIKGQFPCYEVPLRKVVDLCFTLGATFFDIPLKLPEISFHGDTIMVGDTPYGGGAERVMKFFLARAERYIK